MIADLACVQACAATYTVAPTLPVPVTGTDCCITAAPDGTVIVAFRGSVTAEDWARDFICAPVEDRAHPQLGPCHAGFLDAAESIVGEVAAAIGDKRFEVSGHSLGGAVALGVGALLVLVKKLPLAIVTFGAPRFGMQPFVDALHAVPVRQYRRGNDPVPTVPFDVPPVLEFLDARDPLIEVGQAQRDPFACHAIAGYVADVAAHLAAPRGP